MKKALLLVASMASLPVLLVVLLLLWLDPRDHAWHEELQVGLITVHVDPAKAMAMLSHPMVARLFDGGRLHTGAGTWRGSVSRQGLIELRCEPCRLAHRSLGPAPLRFARVDVQLRREVADQYSGLLRLHAATHAISLPWSARLDSRGAKLTVHAASMPMADLVAVLGQDLPESRMATTSGTLTFNLQAQLPAGSVDIDAAASGFTVTGLGTEILQHVALPAHCLAPSPATLSGWLPAAVIAAEDQKFRSHPGYDLGQITAAARSNQSAAALSGASTLTQQLARLLYTGGERSPRRKLRELLYAVEMEQTLGKARILQLYLALAPWGDGVCGAENAALRYLGKPASALTPTEAAWLSSLLVNPEAQLHRQALAVNLDTGRMRHILDGMRPMSNRRLKRAIEEMDSLRPLILEQMRAAAISPPAPAAPSPLPHPSAAGPGRSGTPAAQLLARQR